MAFQLLRRCKPLHSHAMRPSASPRPLKLNGILLGGGGLAMAVYTSTTRSPLLCESATTPQSSSPFDTIKKLFGFDSNDKIESEVIPDDKNSKDGSQNEGKDKKENDEKKEDKTSNNNGKVVIELDEELVESLPVVPLAEVREADGMNGGRLLAT
jgi:hypothetical protein